MYTRPLKYMTALNVGVGEPEHDDSRRRDISPKRRIHLASWCPLELPSPLSLLCSECSSGSVAACCCCSADAGSYVIPCLVGAAWDDRTSRIRSSQAAALTDGAQDAVAGVLAPEARLGTDATVLVHGRVLLALVRASLAGGRARLEERPGDVGVVTGVA